MVLTPPRITVAMPDEATVMQMIRSAFGPGSSEEGLRDLIQFAPQILQQAESSPQTAELLETLAEDDPARLLSFYTAAARKLGSVGPREPSGDPNRERDIVIGEAFARLLSDLPPDFHDLDAHFRGAPRVTHAEWAALCDEPSIQAGGLLAFELARYGITPVTVAAAAHAVANLVRRVQRHSAGPNANSVILPAEPRGGEDRSTLDRRALVRELWQTTELPERSNELILGWLMRIAQYVPFLFDGFVSQQSGLELVLERTSQRMSLTERWSKVEMQHGLPAP